MSNEETLKNTLANGTPEEKLEAVLALPDDARWATLDLHAALGGDDLRLEVAILDALYRINQDPQTETELIALLDRPEAMGDAGEELYMMARIGLNRIQNDDDDVLSGEGVRIAMLGVPEGPRLDRLAVVIHGTWASDGTWWRPGGDFHAYLLDDLGMNYLYKDDDPFVWSGRNRDAARHKAATALNEWILKFDPKVLEVYAHSHGANVAMIATHAGLTIDKLVMMSPPVRKDYFARWDRVVSAYNIQASFDPVVGLARGGQWFGNDAPNVHEKKIPSLNHSASHEPQVWKDNNLPAFVGIA